MLGAAAVAVLCVLRFRRRATRQPATTPATVYLVGAGPGSPDLITLRGIRLLETCSVVLTDRLVSPWLVEYAQSHGAQVVNVGKSADKDRLKQGSIDDELVRLAWELGAPGTIVRLKGGDPFVFGLGGSEVLALARAQVPCIVVPGLSSSLAVPTLCHVPLTHKDVSSGFIVLSGHAGCSGLEWQQLPQVTKPAVQLVVLMIAKNLEVITDFLLTSRGWASSLSCVLIQNGSTPSEKRLVSTLALVATQAQAGDMVQAPLILVVGECAGLLPPPARPDDDKVPSAASWGQSVITLS